MKVELFKGLSHFRIVNLTAIDASSEHFKRRTTPEATGVLERDHALQAGLTSGGISNDRNSLSHDWG